MTNEELEEVICGLHRRIALTTAGTPLQDDLIKAVGALRIAVKHIAELEAQLPKEGEWISLDDFRGKYNEFGYKCSECGEQNDYQDNFCSNCGARMKHNDSNVLGALEGKEQVENILYGYDNIDDDEYEDDLDWEEPADLEMGYDPYLGCYTDDC